MHGIYSSLGNAIKSAQSYDLSRLFCRQPAAFEQRIKEAGDEQLQAAWELFGQWLSGDFSRLQLSAIGAMLDRLRERDYKPAGSGLTWFIVKTLSDEALTSFLTQLTAQQLTTLMELNGETSPLAVFCRQSKPEQLRRLITAWPAALQDKLWQPRWSGSVVLALLRSRKPTQDFIPILGPERWAALWGRREPEFRPLFYALQVAPHEAEAAYALCPADMRAMQWEPDAGGRPFLDALFAAGGPTLFEQGWRLAPETIRRDYWKVDAQGRSPLHRLLAHSRQRIDGAMLQGCPQELREQLWGPDKLGRTPMHYLCMRTYVSKNDLDGLLALRGEQDLQLWQPDAFGATPTHYLLSSTRSAGLWCRFRLRDYCPSEALGLQWAQDKQGRGPLQRYMMLPGSTSQEAFYLKAQIVSDCAVESLCAIDADGRNILHLIAARRDYWPDLPEWLGQLRWHQQALLSQRDKFGMRPLDIALLHASDAQALDLFHPAPLSVDSSLSRFLKLSYVPKGLWRRLFERNPAWGRGDAALPEAQALADAFNNFLLGPDQALSATTRQAICDELLAYVFKMNQDLELNCACLSQILSLFRRFDQLHTQLYLALQTHSDLEEIESALLGWQLRGRPFEQLGSEQQWQRLCCAQVFRRREDLGLIRAQLKEASQPRLIEQALKYMVRTGIAPSKNTTDYLLALLTSADCSQALDALTIEALAACRPVGDEELIKQTLLHCLDSPLRKAAVKALLSLSFQAMHELDQAVLASLLKIAAAENHVPNRCELALLLSLFPDQDALRAAARLAATVSVEHGEAISYIGNYLHYSSKPAFETGRSQLQQALAQRVFDLERAGLRERINERLQAYRRFPSDYPQLQALQQAIEQLPEGSRNSALPLYYPDKVAFYRGLNHRKGYRLGRACLADTQLSGCAPVDLSLHDFHDRGSWAKLGQTFFSSRLGSIMPRYYDADKTLIVIRSSVVNEARKRLLLRQELEVSVNAVFYTRIRHQEIAALCLPRGEKDRMEGEQDSFSRRHLRERLFPGSWKRLSRHERMRLRHAAQETAGGSLAQRTLFVAGTETCAQIRQRLARHGLEECTQEALAEEMLRRCIGLQLLLEDCSEHDPLHACLQAAIRAHQILYVS